MPQIRDLMNTQVVTIDPDATVVDAAQKMIQQEKGPLPVVEGTRVTGIVTDRDLIARVVAAGRDPKSVKVRDVATTDLVTARPDQDLEDARQLLAQHQLDRLLIVEGEQLVGIISEADLRVGEGPLMEEPIRTDQQPTM